MKGVGTKYLLNYASHHTELISAAVANLQTSYLASGSLHGVSRYTRISQADFAMRMLRYILAYRALSARIFRVS